MKQIIRAVPSRMDNVNTVLEQLPPSTLVSIDDRGMGGMGNFLTGLRLAGDDRALHMEDDIILTSDFWKKATAVINQRPNEVIQFFSMRGKDLTVGSRVEPGSTFISNLCFYLPRGMSRALLEYFPRWPRIKEHPTGYDLMMADFFKENGIRYYIHVPSLVQHRIGKSVINPRRGSTNRISKTFIP